MKIFVICFSLMATSFLLYFTLFATSSGTHVVITETNQIWCQAESDLPSSAMTTANYVVRVCVIIGDTLVLAFTWAKTYTSLPQLRKMKMGTVTECVVRDGTLYFSTILILNFTALFVKTPLVITIYHTITGILVSRFLLDLRDVAIGQSGGYIGGFSTPSKISFGGRV
ncbi:hypothetical protein BC629DRAFT_1738784 [Irpex lacteus]|nr:hypothetical protein BC629DRAFT_1738784 [Irpex lacteus]